MNRNMFVTYICQIEGIIYIDKFWKYLVQGIQRRDLGEEEDNFYTGIDYSIEYDSICFFCRTKLR